MCVILHMNDNTEKSLRRLQLAWEPRGHILVGLKGVTGLYKQTFTTLPLWLQLNPLQKQNVAEKTEQM